MATLVLVRGGGDLASGVTLRLVRAGLQVVATELAQPLAVRRLVAFSEAVYEGETSVEGIPARRVNDPTDTLRILMVLSKGAVPVLVDPEGESIAALHPTILVDARMLKKPVELVSSVVPLIIGLGPGFTPGENCHAAVETNRGHMLGRVYWQSVPQADTGVPDEVFEKRAERVLRAPATGVLQAHASICDHVEPGQLIAEVDGATVAAPFSGRLRGLLRSGMPVSAGMKIGDVDPRDDPQFCTLVSDKSLAVGGGVLEAILSRADLRPHLWKR
ncbi:MAG: selenium-dependent molybdenum cofactor biosynthesis protein YqeB [Anaerolineales bacterium]|nr:selenium-dependent molybdenum cofactor biosynthesis protein YqeB [Anaerolineales bacterium]